MSKESAVIHLYPTHPRVAVSGIVVKGREILMVKRANPPAKDTWAPPGGSVKLGETIFDAVKREVMEETGVEVGPVRTITHVDAIYLDKKGAVQYHYVILYVEARYIDGTPRAMDDAKKACWMPLEVVEGIEAAGAACPAEKIKIESETLKIIKEKILNRH